MHALLGACSGYFMSPHCWGYKFSTILHTETIWYHKKLFISCCAVRVTQGAVITAGRAKAVVVATGQHTAIGKIRWVFNLRFAVLLHRPLGLRLTALHHLQSVTHCFGKPKIAIIDVQPGSSGLNT